MVFQNTLLIKLWKIIYSILHVQLSLKICDFLSQILSEYYKYIY